MLVNHVERKKLHDRGYFKLTDEVMDMLGNFERLIKSGEIKNTTKTHKVWWHLIQLAEELNAKAI